MMKLRAYLPEDQSVLQKLFYDSVHHVCAFDYTKAQLEAWAPSVPLSHHWKTVFAENTVVVAETDGIVSGFGDLSAEGWLCHLFVDPSYQHQGIASAICYCIEQIAVRRGLAVLKTEASLPAKPFFESKGFRIKKEQRKPCRSQFLTNFVMEKDLGDTNKRRKGKGILCMNNYLEISKDGHLMLGKVDSVALAKEYGTPLYVMEEDKIREAMSAFRQSIDDFYDGKGLVCYASKAFSCKEIYRIAKDENIGIDVVSSGELYTALSVDFPMDRVCFHGNNKSPAELEMALTHHVGRIVVDNLTELSLLNDIAEKRNQVAPILFRIKPGVDAHTHRFIRTGQIDSKFGLALETGEAMEAVKLALRLKNVHLLGIHCHIGSQIFGVEPFVSAAEIMMAFLSAIKKETGTALAELNLGGGFGIRYTDEDAPIPFAEYMEKVSKTVQNKAAEYHLSQPFVLIEPGRSIVGEAGTTLYTVGSLKEIPHIRTYLAVDGGMCDNPRYALYGSKYEMLLANKANAPADSTVTVAGKCCESGDLLGENVALARAVAGDILAVCATGAYNYSMSSHYNKTPTPPVVMVKDGHSRLIVKGETLDDLLRNDL